MIPTGKRVSRDIITSAVRTPSLNKSFLQASWNLMKNMSLYFSVTTYILLDAIKPADFILFLGSHVQLSATRI